MPNILDQMSGADSLPQEAAQNIDGAKFYDVAPTYFKEIKPNLQPEIDTFRAPTEATTTVADYVTQSPEHAALAKPDVEHLSTMEKIVKFGADQMFDRRTTQEEISELALKKMFKPEDYTEDDDFKLSYLNERAKSFTDYGLTSTEQIPGLLAGSLTSIGASIYKHKELIAGATASGGILGAAGGSAIGGVGAVPGAIAGATEGLVTSSLIAMTVDGVNHQMGAVYNELSNPIVLEDRPNLPPKILDEETKKYTAMAVGVITGGIQAVVGTKVAKTIPFLNKLLTPNAVAKLVADPTTAAITKSLFDLGKSMSTGVGGGAQLATEIFAKELVKNYDGSEGSLLNSIQSATLAIGKNADQIVQATAVAGLTAGTITGAAVTAGFKTTKSGFQKRIDNLENVRAQSARDVTPAEPKLLNDIVETPKKTTTAEPTPRAPTPTEKSVQVLHLDSTLDSVIKISEQTQIKKLSPSETIAVQEKMLDSAGIKEIHLDPEEVTKFANTDEKAAKVRNIIDPSGAALAAMNATIKVKPIQFLQLVEAYPEASELAKLTPEGPTVGQGKKFVESFLENQKKQQEIKQKLNVPDITPEEKTKLETQLAEITKPSIIETQVLGESDFMDMSKLEEAAKVFMKPEQLKNYVEAQTQARQQVVDAINEAATHEMNKVVDVVAEQVIETQYEQEYLKIKNDPNVNIVDKFTVNPEIYPTQRYTQLSELTEAHHKKGYSPFAIDPRLLPDKLKRYLDDPQLKKHKVFVKGGLSPDDSARLIGVNSGENLLKILSSTPSRDDIVQLEVNRKEQGIREQARRSVDLNETAIAKAYDNQTYNAVQTMRFMKSHKWSDMRGGIKKIALIPPTIDEVKLEARETVKKMTVGQLNPNAFKIGMRKSNRLAVDAIVKNQPEEAFRQQKHVALNSALTKESMLAIGRINRIVRIAKNIEKPETQELLKRAGKAFDGVAEDFFINAANELIDVFNLNPNKKNTAERGSFLKWAQKMIETGDGNFVVPERLSDVRQTLDQMTVEQVLVVGDRLKNILHEARHYNKLYTEQKKLKDAMEFDQVVNKLHEQASSNFDYKPERNVVKQEASISTTEATGKKFSIAVNSMERPQHLFLKLDNNNVNGPFNELYRKIADGNAKENELAIETFRHFEKIINRFNGDEGKGEFQKTAEKFEIKQSKMDKLVQDVVEVPEFAGIESLNNGKISKIQLFMMELNYGNEGNLVALERFGVDRKTIRAVLDRELDHEHFEMAQAFRDIFKSFEPEIKALQERTEGTEVKFVEAVPYEAKGRVYPGGYFPLLYIGDEVKLQAEKVQGTQETTRLDKLRQRFYAQAMTEQGHLEERVGSNSVLDLNPSRIAYSITQVIHDLAMREPIRDVAKILTHETVRKDIVAILGPEGYANITDMVIDVADSVNRESYSKSDAAWLKMLQHFGAGFQTVAIAGKISSLIIQPVSLFYAVEKMGIVQGGKHLSLTTKRLLANPSLWKEYYDLAAEIHPTIRDVREDLEGDFTRAFSELIPKKKGAVRKAIAPLVVGRDVIQESCFAALGRVDQMNKVLVVLSAYSQALNGDAPNIPGGNHAEAVKYASNVAELTQTHSNVRNLSPIQKNKMFKAFGMLYFFNDANNVFNSTVAAARKARQKYKETGDAVSRDDWRAALKASKEGVVGVMSFMLIMAMAKEVQDIIHNQKTALTTTDLTDPEKALKAMGKTFATQPIDEVVGTVPYLRDMVFASGKYWQRRKVVEIPQVKIMSDMVTGLVGLTNYLKINQRGEFGQMNNAEKKALLYSLGYAAHIPSDAIYKYLIKPFDKTTPVIHKGVVQEFLDEAEKYLKGKENKDEFDKEIEQLKNELAPSQGLGPLRPPEENEGR